MQSRISPAVRAEPRTVDQLGIVAQRLRDGDDSHSTVVTAVPDSSPPMRTRLTKVRLPTDL